MTAKTRNLKDYCHTNGARGHYDAGVMFFREHDGDIRRCVIHTEELHALANDNDVQTPGAFEQIYKAYRARINAAADDQLLHGDDRETVIIKKIFLDL